jgi:hypothetical protein
MGSIASGVKSLFSFAESVLVYPLHIRLRVLWVVINSCKVLFKWSHVVLTSTCLLKALISCQGPLDLAGANG